MRFPLRTTLTLFFACAFVLGLAACGGGADEKTVEDVPVDAIALVGDQEVPKAEYDALLDRAKQSYKAQERPFPEVGSPEYNDLKEFVGRPAGQDGPAVRRARGRRQGGSGGVLSPAQG